MVGEDDKKSKYEIFKCHEFFFILSVVRNFQTLTNKGKDITELPTKPQNPCAAQFMM